ncbi:MAG: nucleoside triphosphate pyrophosphatase [Candidatus Sumerlaeota bacterium]
MNNDVLVLASASPRRRRLLELLNINFEVIVSRVDESDLEAPGPVAFARLAAEEKCREVAARLSKHNGVLGADTVVHFESLRGMEILGKPSTPDEAKRMLRSLSGRVHQVTTGVAFWQPGEAQPLVGSETSNVRFRPLEPMEIDEYVATGESLDKAGAYAVQGVGGDFIAQVDGDLQNVIGLPLGVVVKMLKPLYPEVKMPDAATLAGTFRREFL